MLALCQGEILAELWEVVAVELYGIRMRSDDAERDRPIDRDFGSNDLRS